MVSNDVEKLISMWFSMHRSLRERVQGEHPIDPLSFLRLETLGLVQREPKITMHGIAERFAIRPSSATSLVNALVKSGDLTRRHDTRDRRIVHLRITLQGKKNFQKNRRLLCGKLSELLDVLNKKDIKALLGVFEKLTQNAYNS